VAIAEGREQPRSLGVIENRPEAIRRLFKQLGDTSTLRVCYEAGTTGYVLYSSPYAAVGAQQASGTSRDRTRARTHRLRLGDWRRD
jgi:hypothetical protein